MNTDHHLNRALSRRSALVAGASLGLCGSGLRAQETDACGGMTRAHYSRYLELFNANDFAFLDYYHPDVVLELGEREIVGVDGIRELYTGVKQHIRETVELTQYIADANGIAVEIPTTFECFSDWEDSFWGRPLRSGEVLRLVSFGIYQLEDGLFRRIQTARSRLINDWQMEA